MPLRLIVTNTIIIFIHLISAAIAVGSLVFAVLLLTAFFGLLADKYSRPCHLWELPGGCSVGEHHAPCRSGPGAPPRATLWSSAATAHHCNFGTT